MLPHLGRHRLREITPEAVANMRADLDAAGVGASTARGSLFVLQSVMRLAVLQGKLQSNPVKVVAKPRQERRAVRPLSPEVVERLRAHLRLREATLVSVLAYAGLRPGEALALTWDSIRERTILVERSVVLGQEKGTKTNATRTVRLMAPWRRIWPHGGWPLGGRQRWPTSFRARTGGRGATMTTATGASATSIPRPGQWVYLAPAPTTCAIPSSRS